MVLTLFDKIVNLMPLVEAELGIPAAQQELLFNGQPMADKSKSLSGYQVSQDDVILVRRRVPAVGNSSATGPTPEMVRQMLLNAPGLLQHLSRTKPAFADAIRDPSKFLQLFNNEEFRAELMNLLKGPPEVISCFFGRNVNIENVFLYSLAKLMIQ